MTQLVNSKPPYLSANIDVPTTGSGMSLVRKVEIPGEVMQTSANPVTAQKSVVLGLRDLEWRSFLVRSSVQNQLAELERNKLEIERARLEMAREQAALDAKKRVLHVDCLWTDEEAATYLGMSSRWLRDSDVPKVKLPGSGKRCQVRYDPDQVKAYAKKHNTHDLTAVINEQPTQRRKRG